MKDYRISKELFPDGSEKYTTEYWKKPSGTFTICRILRIEEESGKTFEEWREENGQWAVNTALIGGTFSTLKEAQKCIDKLRKRYQVASKSEIIEYPPKS